MSKITIIIPTFNSSRYLDDALKSVEAQKLSNYEVIIVDDGSTIQEHNAYKKIITNYSNINLVRKKNGGAASARNFGAKYATGDFLAFLDSDDIWLTKKITSQMDIINQSEDIGLVLGNIIVADESLKAKYKSAKKIPEQKHKIITNFFQGKIVMNTPTILVRKSVFDIVGGFPEDLRYREDHYFLMSVADICKISCDEKYLTVRRERSGSLSNVKDIETEIEKHSPFWIKSKLHFPFVDISAAKRRLLIKLYIYYLRNNRTDDIVKIKTVTWAFDKKYGFLFSLLSNASWFFKMLYRYRIKIKNVRL